MNNASNLKQRITVKRRTLVPDGFGGNSETLATIGTYWCQIIETSGDVITKSNKPVKETKIDIIIRKETADYVMPSDLIYIENDTRIFKLDGSYQTIENFWVKMKATNTI